MTEVLMNNWIDRRRFLGVAAGALAAPLLAGAGDLPETPRTSMGIASNAWDVHFKIKKLEPMDFLAQCRELGLAGMQLPLGTRDADYCAALRQKAEQWGMYIEASIVLLGSRSIETFEQQLLTAKAAGAAVARSVVFPGRRYEYFTAAEQFAQASKRAMETLEKVEPIVAKHRMRLAVENHKDQRIPERLESLKRLSSEWIGVCVDLGNSFALCEDPLEVARAYAPYAFSAHIKDQSARECPEGFRFADMPLGKGFLDLPAMVKVLREAHPEVRFNYEVITRDPLLVPVLTPKYWATMPDVPARDLGRTLQTVKSNGSKEPFPLASSLPLDRQAEQELRDIRQSISYARANLGL
jgi:sugar phosphate isomerase/epimerase